MSFRLRSLLAALLFILHAANSSASVLLYLRFEEGSGLAAADETGFFNGELINVPDPSPGAGDTGIGWSAMVPSSVVPLTSAPNSSSLHLGPVAYVDLSNGNDLSLGFDFTVEFFIKPEEPFSTHNVFGFGPASDLYMILGRDGDGTLGYQFELESQFSFGPITGLQLGGWQHVAFVKAPGEFSLYLDGSIVANTVLASSTDGPYFFPGTDLTADRTIGGESGTWRGWIDEFRISDTALTPDEFLGAFLIPEPSTLLLILFGVAILGLLRKQKRSRT